MSCKYCGKEENKQYAPCLECKVCKYFVHLDCLQRTKTPGNFLGDVFFDFTCAECSHNGEEIFERGKISWFHCLVLVLNDLSLKYAAISNQGYFHWRTHIGSFINRNWHLLFHPQFKKRKNWAGTFSGTLSHFSPMFFLSGSNILNEQGWWKLSHKFSPALIKHCNLEIIAIKQRERPSKNSSAVADKDIEITILKRLLAEMGYTDLLVNEIDPCPGKSSGKEMQCKKLKLDNVDSHLDFQEHTENNDYNNDYKYSNEANSSTMDNYLSNYFLDGEESMSDFDSLLPDFDDLSECSSSMQIQVDKVSGQEASNIYNSYLSSGENGDSDSTSHFMNINKSNIHSEDSNDSKLDSRFSNIRRHRDKHPSINIPVAGGLFGENVNTSDELPWEEGNSRDQYCKDESITIATEYEEVKTLNYLNELCRKANYKNIDKKLIRLRAKLALRKLKRSKHLPVWNLDSLVCRLYNFPVQDYSQLFSQQEVRILDRFQHVTESLSGATISTHVDFATRLTGTSEMTPFLSPYSGRLLKPYIRRDTKTKPVWLKLMDELNLKVNGVKNQDEGSLDYCYVRPQHIASINSLCAQFFWPGIDLTEVLQYPDFSCVVLYKKLVIGFALLVPDVSISEAYISFIFTRPHWRNSGIANFMLYHLIQTCIDKDITLHVSPTNPAVFLYQKFGFKVEELNQDFYEKYFPAESTECKHALSLRLCR